MGVLLVDVLHVRNVVEVQRPEHILVDKARDRVVRRDDHVIARGPDARIQVFVRVEGVVDDLDAGLLLEPVEQVCVDIFAPVIDVQDIRGGVAAAAGQQPEHHGGGERQSERSLEQFHDAASLRAASRRFSSRDWRTLMTMSSTRTNRNSSVETALIFGVMRWRVIE